MTKQKKNLNELKLLVKQLRVQYADDPNIESIGWGLPVRGGALKDGPCILFFVREKLPSKNSITAIKSQPIPDEIEGYKTDVQSVKLIPTQAGNRDEIKYDPLRGGVATSNSEEHILWFNGFGTLGILGRDNTTNAPIALSNWHVWADGGEVGDQIIQPGHPTGGDHVEAIGKVLACGPLVTSLIEWESPSPIAAGLYGAAAGAAIAAAASDYRDPTRRGQDNTVPDENELTLKESVDFSIEYPNLPLPGVAFQTDVKWKYTRETSHRVLDYGIEESNTNTQFLLGKMVFTDKAQYQPGETVGLTAAIWDYQPRPCDGYHVIAHLIPHNNPDTALRTVLEPTACPSHIPYDPPAGEEPQEKTCIVFENYPTGAYSYKGAFEWLQYLDTGQRPLEIVDWFSEAKAIQMSTYSLQLRHPPTNSVIIKVAQFTNSPVTARAYNAAGVLVAEQTAPSEQGTIFELELTGNGIVSVVLSGGGGEGLLISYCIHAMNTSTVTSMISKSLMKSIHRELPDLKVANNHLQANRCCFRGEIGLPPDENPGKWDIYLTVQNINHVPEGTPPEEAAAIIGGHVLSAHTSPEILTCGVIMLLDHVFDVI